MVQSNSSLFTAIPSSLLVHSLLCNHTMVGAVLSSHILGQYRSEINKLKDIRDDVRRGALVPTMTFDSGLGSIGRLNAFVYDACCGLVKQTLFTGRKQQERRKEKDVLEFAYIDEPHDDMMPDTDLCGLIGAVRGAAPRDIENVEYVRMW